ncbi:MAG: methyltransferase domain-containing protein [Candidatus Delongbacteria bacterium]|nr:methyltransferase domain-containing protein [Candidatus Delongbacteria bacterium]
MKFTNETLFEIKTRLKKELKKSSLDFVEFEVIDPDISVDFSGTVISIKGTEYIYRPFKIWVDLAEILKCRILTPEKASPNTVKIRFAPLNISNSWHTNSGVDIREKYGVGSIFAQIKKLEEPYFLSDYMRSLREINLKFRSNVLNLGINRGDEFKAFEHVYDNEFVSSLNFTGLDHCESAINEANELFKEHNYNFILGDIKDIPEMHFEKQDLILTVGTLQSPDFDGKEIFRYLVQNILKPDGSVILGFPNSRYIDREVVYGAKTKNYTESNMNLLIKDISFYKKYLQQHGFKVITFGKYYVFMVAIKN